jgi:hypothetical protein
MDSVLYQSVTVSVTPTPPYFGTLRGPPGTASNSFLPFLRLSFNQEQPAAPCPLLPKPYILCPTI